MCGRPRRRTAAAVWMAGRSACRCAPAMVSAAAGPTWRSSIPSRCCSCCSRVSTRSCAPAVCSHMEPRRPGPTVHKAPASVHGQLASLPAGGLMSKRVRSLQAAASAGGLLGGWPGGGRRLPPGGGARGGGRARAAARPHQTAATAVCGAECSPADSRVRCSKPATRATPRPPRRAPPPPARSPKAPLHHQRHGGSAARAR
jgi:hypothetical protein